MSISEARAIIEYEPLFGAWHVVRRIGAGAAGSVYEIERDDDNGITLSSAMKVITIPSGGEEEVKAAIFSGVPADEIEAYYESAVRKVTAELEMMEKLRGSRNIVSYEESEIKRHKEGIGWDILVRMELLTPFMDHFDAQSGLNGTDIDEGEVIRMGIDLCKGLEVCRLQDIVHRDIKPANIFVSEAGDYKLGDFGIARIVEETQTSLSRKGTYTYMAPEVYRGEAYGHTADIYSLGMVLYQCLNDGRNIFVPAFPERIDIDDYEKAFARRIAGKVPPEPRHGSGALKAIVQKACSFDKSDRYRTAYEFQEDLEALQRGDFASITALRNGTVPPGGKISLNDSNADALSDEDRKTEAPNEKLSSNRKRIRIIAGIILALLILSGALFAALFPWTIDSITVSSGNKDLGGGTEMYIGDDFAPSYVIKPDHYKDAAIGFASSDESVFTVDEQGVITAKGLGTAMLTMTAEDHSKDGFASEFTVEVEPKVTSITMTDSENRVAGDAIELNTGTSASYNVNLQPDEFRDEALKCKVKDESVVKLTHEKTKNGQNVVTLAALKAGATTIRLSSGGCSIKKKISVTEPPVVYSNYNTGSGSEKPEKTGSRSNNKKTSNAPSKGEFGDFEFFD